MNVTRNLPYTRDCETTTIPAPADSDHHQHRSASRNKAQKQNCMDESHRELVGRSRFVSVPTVVEEHDKVTDVVGQYVYGKRGGKRLPNDSAKPRYPEVIRRVKALQFSPQGFFF